MLAITSPIAIINGLLGLRWLLFLEIASEIAIYGFFWLSWHWCILIASEITINVIIVLWLIW